METQATRKGCKHGGLGPCEAASLQGAGRSPRESSGLTHSEAPRREQLQSPLSSRKCPRVSDIYVVQDRMFAHV